MCGRTSSLRDSWHPYFLASRWGPKPEHQQSTGELMRMVGKGRGQFCFLSDSCMGLHGLGSMHGWGLAGELRHCYRRVRNLPVARPVPVTAATLCCLIFPCKIRSCETFDISSKLSRHSLDWPAHFFHNVDSSSSGVFYAISQAADSKKDQIVNPNEQPPLLGS